MDALFEMQIMLVLLIGLIISPAAASMPRKPNIVPAYGEEGYEEEDPRVMQDPYGRSRGRVPPTAGI